MLTIIINGDAVLQMEKCNTIKTSSNVYNCGLVRINGELKVAIRTI